MEKFGAKLGGQIEEITITKGRGGPIHDVSDEAFVAHGYAQCEELLAEERRSEEWVATALLMRAGMVASVAFLLWHSLSTGQPAYVIGGFIMSAILGATSVSKLVAMLKKSEG